MTPAPITWSEFEKVDIRAGRVLRAEPFPRARRPAVRMWIDFGPELGERKSSAQVAALYSPDALVGRMVLAVVNFPPKQIADFMSEVLVLGVPDAEGRIVLLQPDREVPPGARMF